MMFEFKLPDIGEGVSEGEAVKWLVSEGDAVTEDQPIVEIMTDKATIEIASPRAGKIRKRVVCEGDVVPIGKVLVLIEEGGTPAEPRGPREEILKAPAPPAPPAQTPKLSETRKRILASPATQRLAHEQGIDLASVSGSGPLGRVTAQDVEAFLRKTPSGAGPALSERKPRPSPPSGREERIPFRGVRKKIAEHMVRSRRTAMHFTQIDEADMTALVEFRAKAKVIAAAQGVRLTYLPFIIRALVKALKEFPALNGSLDDEKQEIVIKHYYNIGIAIQTDAGLMVPVVKNADRKNPLELAREIQVLAERARSGKLSLEDLKGGTFTVTSTGASGALFGTPIINYPELGILGVYRIVEKPVAHEGRVVLRHMGYLSLSSDHRVIDGAVGAEFLRRVVEYVENPLLLSLEE
ncbi:MAG: dihydrolipoamide acetyltransferase family protein [Pseudomonadota bacterium]